MHLLDNFNAFSMMAKIFSWKCFGEDVSKLFSILTIMQLNFAFLLCFSDKMILDENMLWSFMTKLILDNCNCWFVITIQNSPFFLFFTNVFKYYPKPNILRSSLGCWNIFCFGSGLSNNTLNFLITKNKYLIQIRKHN